MSETNPEFELFAGIVHGLTAFGHTLGLIHAIRQESRFDGVIHGAALIYDVWAVRKHWRKARHSASPEAKSLANPVSRSART